jgi:hypothetical protein
MTYDVALYFCRGCGADSSRNEPCRCESSNVDDSSAGEDGTNEEIPGNGLADAGPAEASKKTPDKLR